jgi:hypothetical protein
MCASLPCLLRPETPNETSGSFRLQHMLKQQLETSSYIPPQDLSNPTIITVFLLERERYECRSPELA